MQKISESTRNHSVEYLEKLELFWSEISAIFHKSASRQRLGISGGLPDGHIFFELHILHGSITDAVLQTRVFW